MTDKSPYTNPELRERLKKEILMSNKGAAIGQWSAIKSQLLALRYKAAGGGYKGKRTAAQKSLKQWTKQKWATKSGKRSQDTGERYLPKAVIEKMSASAYAATSAAKAQGMDQGQQVVSQPTKARNALRKFLKKGC